MYKIIVVILILTTSITTIYAQNMKVDYTLSGVSCGTDKSCDYTLLLSDTLSVWDHKDEVAYDLLVKNSRKKLFQYIPFGSKNFHHEDTLNSMKWKMTTETKVILEKMCHSATTTFRGRDYVAFFTLDLPYNNGPWKFGGLPGLILEIKSTDGACGYVATSINRNKDIKIVAPDMSKYKFLTWQQYTEKYRKFLDDLQKQLKAQKPTDAKDNKCHIKIERIEITYPAAETGEGLEY